ncbi:MULTISPECIES: DUF2637 domain-containing protein [Streptomyces]|uniref:DUF2637 domain-containing protein n=1 Tax=Streptomyces TaxID=1883 RepID=UPI00163C5A0B|nr:MULTISPECIES: DUF2637 domain-containing protein [Streptomyces]MBC2879788.1 DUF2637 domain-containing protein [Streptomyces sp. TYQ1024]
MSDTLTDHPSSARRGAVAGAAPDAAGAAPGVPAAVPDARDGAPAKRRLGGLRWPGRSGHPPATAGAAPDAAEATPATSPATPATPNGAPTADESAAADRRAALDRIMGRVLRVAAVAMTVVGVIGFAASYSTLQGFAQRNGFGEILSKAFPIGVDGAILGFLALDLVKTWRRTPWPVLRLGAHLMTLCTIAFNASAGGAVLDDPVRAAAHAVMPVLFIIGVEAIRHDLLHAAREADGTLIEGVPLHRWMLAPWQAWTMYRRMRLAGIPSYREMQQRDKDLEGYRVWLLQQHDGDLGRASETELLPMTMAPHGYTVAEALALPAKWAAEEERRREEDRQRQEEAAERARAAALEAETRAKVKAAEEEIQRLEAEGRVAQAQSKLTALKGTSSAEAEAATAVARAEAERARREADRITTAAERQAEREAQAEESAREAEAKQRAAAAEQQAAEMEEAAAETRRRAAAKNRKAAEDEAAAEDAEKEKKHAAAEAAEAERRAAEATARAAEARRRAAEAELAAVEAEDEARLSKTERAARRVARMLLAAAGAAGISEADLAAMKPEAIGPLVPLEEIMPVLKASQTTASDRRKDAALLIKEGYRG